MGQSNSKTYFIIVGVLGVLGVAILYYSVLSSQDSNAVGQAQAETIAETEPTAFIDVKAALSPRILGNPNAPVKISEHSSFTCGHCGTFHKTTYKELKRDFIDTGKAYLLFSDFPLNGPALEASAVARCLPQDKYFDFVQMLFERQDDWAYEKNYRSFLKREATTYGLSGAEFEACINNKELKDGIVMLRGAAQKQWNITSTPSFVINNKATITGGKPFEEFTKVINEELEKLKEGTP